MVTLSSIEPEMNGFGRYRVVTREFFHAKTVYFRQLNARKRIPFHPGYTIAKRGSGTPRCPLHPPQNQLFTYHTTCRWRMQMCTKGLVPNYEGIHPIIVITSLKFCMCVLINKGEVQFCD